ncbi:MAG: HDOD domain-containing protein [Rhodanobacter sp.]|nr:MAG: HDOD domain-containing protein [Rhodanobacter sp.]TAM13985.1 MAG: HDOD domain-containing protein [Rhodanobacter sp.]TAM37137.1 MAG: HDOD domain-containing protein [Rhodanobacter sp.]
MNSPVASSHADASAEAPIFAAANAPLPVLRVPLLDRERQLYAYELLFHRDGGDDQALLQGVLGAITDGALTRLVRGNRAFLNLPLDLLPVDADVLAHQPRLGVVLQPEVAEDPGVMMRIEQMAQRGCQFLLDLGTLDPNATHTLGVLLQQVQLVRLDAARLAPEVLAGRARDLHQRGLHVVAGQVNDHAIFDRCAALPFEAVQGRYLLVPQPVAVPVLTANRLSMLRLMGALHESNPGPVELGKIVRDDAVLSYKLLSCVNSAYFALPRQLKSVQQAAIFFGVSRMRNWVDTMAMCSMDDRPPELLRAALIRAHMCEGLAKATAQGDPEMAFTVGLFSLLDVLMCAPMEYLLTQLRLAPEINDALTGRGGSFAAVLKQILAWEAGELTKLEVTPQRIEKLAALYLGATQWADQVYAGASGKKVQ